MSQPRLTPEFRTALAALETAYTLHLLDSAHPRESMEMIREKTERLLKVIDAAHQRQQQAAEPRRQAA